jgi:hypothetical protein
VTERSREVKIFFWESVGKIFETSYTASTASEGRGLTAVDQLLFCISRVTSFLQNFLKVILLATLSYMVFQDRFKVNR